MLSLSSFPFESKHPLMLRRRGTYVFTSVWSLRFDSPFTLQCAWCVCFLFCFLACLQPRRCAPFLPPQVSGLSFNGLRWSSLQSVVVHGAVFSPPSAFVFLKCLRAGRKTRIEFIFLKLSLLRILI